MVNVLFGSRSFMISGANSGIGLVTAMQLAKKGVFERETERRSLASQEFTDIMCMCVCRCNCTSCVQKPGKR